MGKLAQIILKQFGYRQAMQMAKKFGLTVEDVRKAAMGAAQREGRGRLGSAYHASPLERGIVPGGLSKYFPGKPIQTFAQRKAHRVAQPVNARLARLIGERQAGRNRLEAARRARLTPDQFEAGLPGIRQGLATLESRSGLYQKNIDKIIAKTKAIKAGKSVAPKEFMKPPYDKKDIALMAALLGGGLAVRNSDAWKQQEQKNEEYLQGEE